MTGRGDAASPPGQGAPAGYRRVGSPIATWLARPECAEEIREGRADFLLRGSGRRSPAGGGGRGGLGYLELAGAAAVGKRALHGGVFGRVLGGLFLGKGRMTGQIEAAERLDRAGVPTPEVLAVGWRRALGVFRALAIVTRAIPRAQNLYEAAREDAPWRRRRVILEKSARLVRAMHDAGFLHADLNVTNLVLGEGPGGDRVYVVDLDGGRFEDMPGPAVRFRSLARLLRSYEKWIAGRWRLSPREEIVFLRTYCGPDRELSVFLWRRLQRYRARLPLRRLSWAILPGGPSSDRRATGP